MLKGNGPDYIAFGLCIALGVFLGLAISDYSDPTPKRIPYGDASNAKLDYEARRTSGTPDDAINWIVAAKRERQSEAGAKTSDGSTETDNYHDALDLEAQWASAAAAERVARLTIWQIFTGAAGIVAVAWSLLYTRKAVEASVRAAAAAEASVAVAQETAKRELRAYVYHAGIKWVSHKSSEDGRLFWRLHPIWSNSGNTPARQVLAYVEYIVQDTELTAEFLFNMPPENDLAPVSIPAKGDITSRFHNVFADELLAIQRGEKHLYVWGVAKYRDVFGGNETYVTRFCVKAGIIMGNPLVPWNQHDNALSIAFQFHHKNNCQDDDCAA